jgi:hypothetical protein
MGERAREGVSECLGHREGRVWREGGGEKARADRKREEKIGRTYILFIGIKYAAYLDARADRAAIVERTVLEHNKAGCYISH